MSGYKEALEMIAQGVDDPEGMARDALGWPRRGEIRDVLQNVLFPDDNKACEAYQTSDQMMCGRCGLQWDVNDPEPPKCGKE